MISNIGIEKKIFKFHNISIMNLLYKNMTKACTCILPCRRINTSWLYFEVLKLRLTACKILDSEQFATKLLISTNTNANIVGVCPNWCRLIHRFFKTI